MWIQQFLNKLLSEQVIKKIKMQKNNKISLKLTKNLKNQNCGKQIDVMHYHIWEMIDNKKLKIE